MLARALYFVHYALLLIFGAILSFAFAQVRPNRKNITVCAVLCIGCGLLQLSLLFLFGEEAVWKLYPLITHLPILLVLCAGFRRRPATACAAIATAYLCCQPAKWIGLVAEALTDSDTLILITRILILTAVGVLSVWLLTSSISDIYQKDTRSILIFSILPMIYYLFDYVSGVYTDFLIQNNRIVVEFLPFLLCCVHLGFCIVYYKEYEKKTEAERKEQIIRFKVEQQAKEYAAIKRSEQEIRLLRHDMRLLLNQLGLYLSEHQVDKARETIAGYTGQVDSTVIRTYCENTAVNYILSNCAAKCREAKIDFTSTVELGELAVDEIMFSSILSNALDNAINAQQALPCEKRSIRLLLKTSDGRLLLSVRNSCQGKLTFVDGLPLSSKKGHGYGTQSIRYLTEKLGGNCRFSVQNGYFLLQVVI